MFHVVLHFNKFSLPCVFLIYNQTLRASLVLQQNLGNLVYFEKKGKENKNSVLFLLMFPVNSW